MERGQAERRPRCRRLVRIGSKPEAAARCMRVGTFMTGEKSGKGVSDAGRQRQQ